MSVGMSCTMPLSAGSTRIISNQRIPRQNWYCIPTDMLVLKKSRVPTFDDRWFR